MKNRNLSITPSVKKGATAKTAAVGGTRRSINPPAAGIMTSMVGTARSMEARWRRNGLITIVKKNFAAGNYNLFHRLIYETLFYEKLFCQQPLSHFIFM